MSAKRIVFRLFFSLLIAAGTSLATHSAAQATICFWSGAATNSWDDPASWNYCNGGFPGVDDVAVIGDVGINPDPVLNGSTQVAQLDVDDGGILVTTTGVTLTTAILNMNGQISGPGSLVVIQTLNWGHEPLSYPSGRLSGGGQITIQAGGRGRIAHSGEDLRLDNFTLNNYGIVEPFSDFTFLVFLNNAAIHNYGTFAMNGTYRDDSDNASFTNHNGATILSTGTVALDTALTNDGLVNILGTEFHICRGGTHTGRFISAAGAILAFGSCMDTFPTAAFNFTPTSQITASRVQFTGMPTNTVSFHGTFGPLGAGSWTTIEVPTTFHSDATVTSFGDPLTIRQAFVMDAVAPSSMARLAVSGPNASFTYSGTINIYTELSCGSNATLAGGGLLRVMPAAGTLRFTGNPGQNGCNLDGKWVENQGAGWLSSPVNITGLNSAKLTNSGTYTAQHGNTMAGSLTFENSGRLVVNNNNISYPTTTIAIPFTNTGSIEILHGNLVFAGDLTLPAGTTNQITGTLDVNHLINSGTLTVNGTVDGNLTNNGDLNMNGAVTGSLVNYGTLSPGSSPGSVTVQGNFSQPSSGALEIELYGVNDRLLITGTAQIAGHLELIEGNTLEPSNFLEMPFLSAGGGISGAFDTVGEAGMIDDWSWSLVQRPNEIAVRLGGHTYLPTALR